MPFKILCHEDPLEDLEDIAGEQPHHPPQDDPFAANDLETPAFLRRVCNRMFQ